jgi:hypothetical protein
MAKYLQGKFTPINEAKYNGDASCIIYRSSWERIAFKWVDTSKDVLKWSSEEIIVPYISPLDNKVHRYYPDMYIQTNSQEFLVEIKPEKETRLPKNKKGKHFEKQLRTYVVNQAKWKAAKEYAEQKGWVFKIITEKTLLR